MWLLSWSFSQDSVGFEEVLVANLVFINIYIGGASMSDTCESNSQMFLHVRTTVTLSNCLKSTTLNRNKKKKHLYPQLLNIPVKRTHPKSSRSYNQNIMF